MRKLRRTKLAGPSRCDTCHSSKHSLVEGQTHLSVYCTHPEGELSETCSKYEYEKKSYPVTIEGENISVSAGRPPLLRKAIKVWLLDILKSAGGTIPAKTLFKKAAISGLKTATLYRAKKELKIKSVASYTDGKIVWHWV